MTAAIWSLPSAVRIQVKSATRRPRIARRGFGADGKSDLKAMLDTNDGLDFGPNTRWRTVGLRAERLR